jgi:hypothetical protein
MNSRSIPRPVRLMHSQDRIPNLSIDFGLTQPVVSRSSRRTIEQDLRGEVGSLLVGACAHSL